MVYQFLNKICPMCGIEISPYDYVIVDGVKYHQECKP